MTGLIAVSAVFLQYPPVVPGEAWLGCSGKKGMVSLEFQQKKCLNGKLVVP
jgi:hypothetical protein